MARQKVAVIMGGPSQEHDISLQSGEAMLAALDAAKYEPAKITIDRSGVWCWGDERLSSAMACQYLKEQGAVALIGLHGTYGEDGTIQALFERYKIPYTGSRVSASLLAMDKSASADVYQQAGIQTPTTLSFSRSDDDTAEAILTKLSVPLVVKPARQGSSVGVHIVKTEANLTAAVEDAFLYDQIILAQQFVKGRELSCGVVELNGELTALPPTEIIPQVSEFFDYKAKYTDGGSKEITPAELETAQTQAVQQIALDSHIALGCGGYSRTDVILDETGEIYAIETNTLPGMTQFSLLPAQAKAYGLTFAQLVEAIVASAQNKV